MATSPQDTGPASMERSKADSLKPRPSSQDCDCSTLGLPYFPIALTYTKQEPDGSLSTHLQECLAHPKQPSQGDRVRKVSVRFAKSREGYLDGRDSVIDPWANCFCDIPGHRGAGDLPPVWIQGLPCTLHSKCCWYCHSGLLLEEGERRKRKQWNNEHGEDEEGWGSTPENFCNNPDCECFTPAAGIRAERKTCPFHEKCCQICHTKMLKAERRREQEKQRHKRSSLSHSGSGGEVRNLSKDVRKERKTADISSSGVKPPRPRKRNHEKAGNSKAKYKSEPMVEEELTGDLDVSSFYSICMCDRSDSGSDPIPPPDQRQCSQHGRCCSNCHEPRIKADALQSREKEKENKERATAHSSPSKSSNIQVLVLSPKRPTPDSETPQPIVKPKKARTRDSSKTSGAIKKARKPEPSALKAVRLHTKQECAEIFEQHLSPRTYDSTTIARDILRVAGIHPTLPPLNAHIV